MRILGKPEAGWSKLCIGTKEYDMSYLTLLPIDWLEGAIRGLQTLKPFTVYGYCEPGRLLCVVSFWQCHLIFEGDQRTALSSEEIQEEYVHLSMLDFCRALHHDIESELDAWSDWQHPRGSDQEIGRQRNRMKKELRVRLNRLDRLIRDRAEKFDEQHDFL